MNIEQWMIVHHYAKNEFQAANIFNGLRLAEVPRFWERARLVILYRRLRNSGIYNTTAECFAAARRGARVPELFGKAVE